MRNKARVVNSVFEDGQVVREKLLEVRLDLGIPDEWENPPTSPAYCSAPGHVMGGNVCTENSLGLCLTMSNTWSLLQSVRLLILALSFFGCVTLGRLLNLSESHFPHLLNEVIIINARGGARSHRKLSLNDTFFM